MSLKIRHAARKIPAILSVLIAGLLFSGALWADNETLGSMAALITTSFKNVTYMITAISYLAGIAFAIGAILKFKQHKDQPGQIPIGQPIGLTVIAAALVFLPSVVTTIGYTAFSTPVSSGPEGSIIGQTP